jgi:hypothetical protein
MSEREIPEIPEWARKLSALFASGECSEDNVFENLKKMVENIENGTATFVSEDKPVVTYKKRKKWTK